MPTEKLYWDDPFAITFEAKDARASVFGERASIVLERTLFYPEAGGQLADIGTFTQGGRDFSVTDVQVDDDGTIHHLLAEVDHAAFVLALASNADARLVGTIDRERRRDHMAQHTAQHALSRALEDVARAGTVSARLGARTCTIDVSLATVADADLARAEDLVNALVRDDVPVRSLFPTGEELAKMDLRRAPKVSANVRIIEIEKFDLSPCGGTHCTRSGQIGVVRISGTERYKGKLRISFHAAARAIADARVKERILAALAADFTCGMLDVGNAVGKLRGELKDQRDALSIARGELVELVAERVLGEHPPDASGTTRIMLERPKDDLGTLRALAGRLTARPDVVAICVAPADDGKRMVVVQRGTSAAFDCGAWLKSTAEAHGSRGGGRPTHAEGQLPQSAKLD